jgi:hypothetical protein
MVYYYTLQQMLNLHVNQFFIIQQFQLPLFVQIVLIFYIISLKFLKL